MIIALDGFITLNFISNPNHLITYANKYNTSFIEEMNVNDTNYRDNAYKYLNYNNSFKYGIIGNYIMFGILYFAASFILYSLRASPSNLRNKNKLERSWKFDVSCLIIVN